MARIPINLSTGTLKEENLIVGIDLGTTHSLIAQMLDGQPVCIADYDKDVIVPSIVHLGEGGEATVGDEAKARLETAPERTIYSVKRLMGKRFATLQDQLDFFSYRILESSEEDGLVRVEIGGKYYTPIELSALILKELKARAEHKLKQPVQKAVITVPAYFNDAQREATRDAGRLAGLDVLRIVNEPTAAALAYGLGLSPDESKRVAVYDLGGGTFDVTILAIEGGVFEVLATHGDTYLGGDDFDRAIQDYWLEKLGITNETIAADKALGQRLRLLAESAKKALSTTESFQGNLSYNGSERPVSLTRETFEQLVQPLVARTLASCKQALQDAELTPSAIDAVLLVGGSTRVPYVNQQVEALFGQAPNNALNPDQVVALGAAVQADILAGNRKDLLLLDVTPLSLGIETSGGLMDVLIPRNSKIPARVGRQYTTQVDGQAAMRITVYQGERDLVKDNRKLAEFELSGIPAMPAGLAKVEVRFLIDADGILRVSAEELRSGVQQEISVKPTYGLKDSEVEQMLLASLQNAESDVATRMRVEAQEEARQRINQTESFLKKHSAALSEEEVLATRSALEKLAAAIDKADKDTLHQQMDDLEQLTAPFAKRVMDKAISEAMVGKDISQ